MKFTGIWIPADIAKHPDLSLTAKLAYGLISSLDNEDGCYASNSYIGKILQIEPRQVRNVIDSLIESGLVIRHLSKYGRTLKTIEKAAIELAVEELKETDHGNELPGGRQKIAGGGGNKLPPYSKEDRKVNDINKALLPLPFSSTQFIEAWNRWVDYRRDLKKPLHWKTINAQFEAFKSEWTEEEAISAIKVSIEKGWLSFFKGRNTNTGLTANDHSKPW
jgi:hypothetical protein